MNRIEEILKRQAELKGAKQGYENAIKEAEYEAHQLTIEWQDMCSHPLEYLEEQDDDTTKCCACGIILAEEIEE